MVLLSAVLQLACPARKAPLEAGVAVEDVTPQWPVRKAYANRLPIRRAYHPVEIKVLGLSDGESRLAIVTADIGFFGAELSEKIHRAVARLGLAPHQVVLNASHNHSGPAVNADLDVLDRGQFDFRYQDFFVAKVVRAIERSLQNLRPSLIGTAQAQCDVCINKRLEGRMEPNPAGPMDRRVRLLQVTDAGTRALRAILFLYGCHPSDVGDDAFGADFLGFARQELERRQPGIITLSAQGTGGDTRVDHRDASGKRFAFGNKIADLESTRSFGRRLADSVEEALKSPTKLIEGPLRSSMQVIELPLAAPASIEEARKAAGLVGPAEGVPKTPEERENLFKARWARHLLSLYARRIPLPSSVPYTVQVVQIGSDFVLVALDGEVFTQIGRQIEVRLQPRRAFVLGYSNSSAGYIPTEDEIPNGGYEIEVYYWWLAPGPFAAQVEKTVVDASVSMVR